MNQDHFKKINDINMYVEQHGKGKGTPILLIAGFSCDHTFWSTILNPLTTHHEVLVLDNRGIGQTDSPDIPYSIEMMAEDVIGLMDQLELKKLTMVGQSMGSAITQYIGKQFPDRVEKMILVNTFNRLTKLPEIVFDTVGELHRMNVPLEYRVRSLAPWVYSNAFLSEPRQLENIIKIIEHNPHPQSLVGYERQLEALKSFDSRSWLHEIKAPTLIIAGDEDIIAPVTGAKEVQQGIGHHTPMTIVPGGHASPIEQPQKVAEAILKFINVN